MADQLGSGISVDLGNAWEAAHSSWGQRFVPAIVLAGVRSAAQVALEAGNSPHVISQYCRELVAEKAAKAWFAITLETSGALKAKLDRGREASVVKIPAKAAV